MGIYYGILSGRFRPFVNQKDGLGPDGVGVFGQVFVGQQGSNDASVERMAWSCGQLDQPPLVSERPDYPRVGNVLVSFKTCFTSTGSLMLTTSLTSPPPKAGGGTMQ